MRQWGGSFRLQLGVIGALSKQSSALALSEFHNGVGPEDLTITRRLYGKLRIDGSIDTHCNNISPERNFSVPNFMWPTMLLLCRSL